MHISLPSAPQNKSQAVLGPLRRGTYSVQGIRSTQESNTVMCTLLSWVEYVSVYSTHPVECIFTHSTQLNWIYQIYSTQLNWVERNAWVWVQPIYSRQDWLKLKQNQLIVDEERSIKHNLGHYSNKKWLPIDLQMVILIIEWVFSSSILIEISWSFSNRGIDLVAGYVCSILVLKATKRLMTFV